jgi:flagellar motor switch protein FliN/FliY
MADSDKVSQDEIEELLRQAQAAAGMNPQPQPPPKESSGTAPSPGSLPREGAGGIDVATAPSARQAPPASEDITNDDIQLLLSQAEQALASVDRPIDPALAGISPYALQDFSGTPASGEKATLELLRDVDLDLRIELGRTQMYLEDVLKLRRGSVVSLDKLAGDPVDIFVNGRMIARGEVLVMNDNFCIRVAELLSGDDVK